jgi:hypothetical protein
VRIGESGVCEREARICSDCLLLIFDGLDHRLRRALELVVATEQVQLVRVHLHRATRGELDLRFAVESDLQGFGHCIRDVFLHGQDIADGTVERLRPQVIAVLRIDELCGHADASVVTPYAALEYIASTERPSNLPNVLLAILEDEGRRARRDTQAWNLRQRVEHLFGQAVRERGALAVFGEVSDRQDSNGLGLRNRV